MKLPLHVHCVPDYVPSRRDPTHRICARCGYTEAISPVDVDYPEVPRAWHMIDPGNGQCQLWKRLFARKELTAKES